MEMFDWSEDQYQVKEEWRSALMAHGAPSVTLTGTVEMLMSFAGNWVILH